MKKWRGYNYLGGLFSSFQAHLLVFVVLYSLWACKPHNTISPPNYSPIDSLSIKTPQSTASILSAPQVYTLNYLWYSTRMAITVKNTAQEQDVISVNAFYVNKKDSIIFITISKMGIEGARLVLEKDSVKYINHLNQTYYWGTYRIFEYILGCKIDFSMIESLFLGQDLPFFDSSCHKDSSSQGITYSADSRTSLNNKQVFEQKLQTDSLSRTIYHYLKDVHSLNSIAIWFDDFISLPDGQYGYQRLKIEISNMHLQLQCQLKSTKLNVPGPTSIKKIEKYKPIEIQ